jgi:hypothetical protein
VQKITHQYVADVQALKDSNAHNNKENIEALNEKVTATCIQLSSHVVVRKQDVISIVDRITDIQIPKSQNKSKDGLKFRTSFLKKFIRTSPC